jgi:3-hydroxyisobutyrate dehydrogenase-like beta-hydroxyacid dehydrogenase
MTSAAAIAWIGAGRLGRPMLANVVNAGLSVRMFDVRPAAVADLVRGNAVAACTLRECVEGASVVVTSLPDDAALRRVVSSEGFLPCLHGATLIETSTISLEASEVVAEACAACGVDYIRLPVSGNPSLAAQAKLSAYASGPRHAWERVQPIVALFTSRQTYMGPGDEARAIKLVLNCIVASLAPLMAEALTLGRRAGLDWASMLDAVAASPLCSPWLKLKLEALRDRDFSPTFPPYMMIKDVDLMLDAARELNVTMPMTAATRQIMQAMCAEPIREEDFFAVVKMIERSSGLSETIPSSH